MPDIGTWCNKSHYNKFNYLKVLLIVHSEPFESGHVKINFFIMATHDGVENERCKFYHNFLILYKC